MKTQRTPLDWPEVAEGEQQHGKIADRPPRSRRAPVGSVSLFSLILIASVLSSAERLAGADVFKAGPDHEVQAGVPQGTVKPMGVFNSKIFPDTTRDWFIYNPAK